MNTPSEKSMKIAISLAKDWMNDLISEPCDLENRIAQAIDTARREALLEAAKIAETYYPSEQADAIAVVIRERINLNGGIK